MNMISTNAAKDNDHRVTGHREDTGRNAGSRFLQTVPREVYTRFVFKVKNNLGESVKSPATVVTQ